MPGFQFNGAKCSKSRGQIYKKKKANLEAKSKFSYPNFVNLAFGGDVKVKINTETICKQTSQIG